MEATQDRTGQAQPAITEFLEARIAEDEAVARAATPGPWNTMTEETGNGENIYYTVEHGNDQLCDMTLTSRQGSMDAEHIARHDPARVLAECAAKRAIIEAHPPYYADPNYDRSDVLCGTCGLEPKEEYSPPGGVEYPCPTLKALASVYAGHPDYQEAWRA